jgi:2',3'-cyclic-nucleotide 2'-phosphodiesterase (5'-nucleotidase family)
MTVLQMSGNTLLQVLEHAVGDAPFESKFLQVSGLKFSFDKQLANGKRISNITLENGGVFNKNVTYTVATLSELYEGQDGYSMLKSDQECSPLHDEDNYRSLLVCLR